jgi:LysM repeat protein
MVLPGLTNAAGPGVYVVRAGDTLIVIAGRLNVPLADLLRANQLTVNSLIVPGQRLTVPGTGGGGASGATYTVVAGDWLGRIASRHGVTLAALLQANGLTVNSVIVPGQRLTIPGAAGAGGAPSGGSAAGTYTVRSGDALSLIASRHGVTLAALLRLPGAGTGGGTPSPAPAPTAPAGGSTYTVRRGDYLAGIAARHGVSLDALLAANGFNRNSLITPGMTIRLPGATPTGSVQRVINYALAQVGKPYVFGARGPGSFDCSGLTLAAYSQVGVALVHYSAAQARQGTAVNFRQQPIRAGDLVFQDTNGDGVINHVGIALNATSWVQARDSRHDVSVGPLPATSRIVSVRRFLPNG